MPVRGVSPPGPVRCKRASLFPLAVVIATFSRLAHDALVLAWGDAVQTAFFLLMAVTTGAGLALLGVYIGDRFL